jgi:aminoglycoside 6'-N-acetyltransferase
MNTGEHPGSPHPLTPSPQGEGERIALRCATPADAALLRAWDAKQHVIDASGDPDANAWDWDYEIPRQLSWRESLIAEEASRPIGFLQIIDPREEETHYWGECAPDLRALDIWIGDEGDIGRGLGSEMMRLAIARCFAAPRVTGILIDPLADNTRAHRFYERLGFRFVERRTFLGCDDCFVYRLDRANWRKEA